MVELNENNDRAKLAGMKAGVLCRGLRHSEAAEAIYDSQHPTGHKRTGNAGIQIGLGDFFVNAIFGENFCESSPYHIEKKGEDFWLFDNGAPVRPIVPIEVPAWYGKKTKDGFIMADLVLREGKETLITGIWNNCCYYENGTQCKYCVFGYEKGVERKSIANLIEVLQAALAENPDCQLNLTGGNTFTPDRGIGYYLDYLKKIRAEVSVPMPVSLEVSPPEDLKYLDAAIDAGANGFSINIEVWDEARRKEISPGKSKIPRGDYFKAWERAAKRLGGFTSSSVIIVGLDKPENIEKGIKELTGLGIKPTLIPFRPFAKCALKDLSPADTDELLELSAVAGRALKAAGARPECFIGCEHCGACSLEKDAMN